MPSSRSRRPRRPRAQRRSGYVGTIVVDALLLFGINQWPGWDVLPFLTPDMTEVLPWINASLVAGIVTSAVWLVVDPPWLRALGTVVTASIGLVGVVRMWQVFPFDFSGSGFDWTLVVQVLLIVGIVGSVIGVLAAVIGFVVAVARAGSADH
ncbi:hypothetical protein ACWDTI_02045 [Gordonia sp. NPDC003424]